MTNPPAFPTPAGHATVKEYHPGHGEFERTVEICKTGMDLRDYFAAKAMQAFIATMMNSSSVDGQWWGDESINVARCAYSISDAMLAERNKNPQPKELL